MNRPWVGPRETCPRCGSNVPVSGEYLADHEGNDGRKCLERPQPTKGKKKGKSVWAIGGGLPTLGRRR